MDTHDKYLDTVIGIELAEGRHENREDRTFNVPDRGLGASKKHRLGYDGTQVPVDGWVTFYWPDRPKHEPHMAYSFPFRDAKKDDFRWLAAPDADDWSKRPIWKWQNPEEPLFNLTLAPSLGISGNDGISFHCYIRDGEIDWL